MLVAVFISTASTLVTVREGKRCEQMIRYVHSETLEETIVKEALVENGDSDDDEITGTERERLKGVQGLWAWGILD